MVGGLGLKGLGVWGLGLLAARRLQVRCRHGTPANPEMPGVHILRGVLGGQWQLSPWRAQKHKACEL